MRKVALVFLTMPLFLIDVFAQSPVNKTQTDPYSCLGVASNKSLDQIRREVEILKSFQNKTALTFCSIAELLKRLGDYEAEKFYRLAIEADRTEPAYEIFLADYLRNYRGAMNPLFPKAESHYIEAQKKLDRLGGNANLAGRAIGRLERGLVALYQKDGLPIAHLNSASFDRPFMFFASINKYADTLDDFDRVDEVRSFTSEALFASSRFRLNRPLTEDELKDIIRTKSQYETLNRIRFRYKGMPVIDLFYKYRALDDAQITNFFEPGRFNDVRLNEYGVAIEKPLSVASSFDLFMRGAVKRLDRKGIVEFLPDVHEEINQYEGNLIFSKYAGPDKVNLEYTVVYQDIDEDRANPSLRNRAIQGGKFTYQVFRPLGFLQRAYENRFENRGLDLFAGFLHDREAFGDVDVIRKDFYLGTSLKGIGSKGRIDISVQPTILTSRVENDPAQRNSQYRTNASLLYRFIDEEAKQEVDTTGGPLHLAFLHLVFPFKHDLAIDGPEDFENFRFGGELSSKLFFTGKHRTSFLLSLRYDYQRFFKLDKSQNLFSLTLSMGF